MSDENELSVAYDINDDRRRDRRGKKYYGAMARGCSIACSFCGFGLQNAGCPESNRS